jgi:hypothetical protein
MRGERKRLMLSTSEMSILWPRPLLARSYRAGTMAKAASIIAA